METIMIIEDDRRIREELSLLLISAGYTALAVTEFTEEPIKLLKENHPDLILMDINIPGGSGVSLCAQIRKISQVPVIFVTGRTGAMDELEALMTGGDDYITKPYQAPVLLAHIRAVLRRTGKSGTMQEAELECRGVRLSLKDASVTFQGKRQELTKTELKLMYYLFTHAGEIVPRLDLVEFLWDSQIHIDDNTLSVNMMRIREKLCALGAGNLIQTKRGMGYKI